MEKQHPDKRKQHSEPELAANRRAEIWRCAIPWAPCPALASARPGARASAIHREPASRAAAAAERGRAGSGPGSRQTEAAPADPASAAWYDPIA
jgi:hypothetical protein